MKICFHKYQGTGNDFVMIDNRQHKLKLNVEEIKRICDRRFGVGADGIILIESHEQYDFEMNYYNADGSQSFCGNGSRCIVRFAEQLNMIQHKAHYLAIDGAHISTINKDQVATQMNPVHTFEKIGDAYFIHTGSPHYIKFVDDVTAIDLLTEAKKIRFNDRFKKEGTNVNYLDLKENQLRIRTYERGVEGETLSCGTGVTASAIAYCLEYGKTGKQEIKLNTSGGMLSVLLEEENGNFKNIALKGPAQPVFEGELVL